MSSRVIRVIAEPDTQLAHDSLLMTVFVGDTELFLASEKGFPTREKFEIDVVEDNGIGFVVPFVQVEQVAHVCGRAKRSRPLSFPESSSSHQ